MMTHEAKSSVEVTFPGFWDDDHEMAIFENQVISSLAYHLYNLCDHPMRYFYKDAGNLALRAATDWWHAEFTDPERYQAIAANTDSGRFVTTTARDLHKAVTEMVHEVPEIAAFNKSILELEGVEPDWSKVVTNHGDWAKWSRSWIDLDALARNIVNLIIVQYQT